MRPFVGLLVTGFLSANLAAATLPEGFTETRIAAGLNGATAMQFAPDGRLFVCEQTGALRVIKDDKLLDKPFLTLAVDSSWERGLIGLAFDPDFAKNGFLYVNYVAARPYPHHRISRFTVRGDEADPKSEVLLLEGDNQDNLGGGVKNGHQGGAIHFGKDGCLYIAIGDQTAGKPAQDLTTFQGKILRIRPDGSIPKDNPFYEKTAGKYRAIWALGLRNPFTFAVQPGTGRILINDVGGANEEINEGIAGANYGWPTADHGPTKDARYRGPIHWYKENSISGGVFYNPDRPQFPKEYLGKYLFADYKLGWIKTLDADDPAKVATFASALGTRTIVDLKVGPDGCLYYLNRNAWVRDQEFKPNTGAVHRIRYTGDKTPASINAHPASATAVEGKAAQFHVSASGTAPVKFQWQRDGQEIPDATAPSYTLAKASLQDDGARFRCLVSNAHGAAVSEAALLKVKPAPAARDTQIAPRPGSYTGPITVVLSSRIAGVTLRYTTDGVPATAESKAYEAPFILKESAMIRAQAFKQDKPVGPATSATYTIAGSTPYGLAQRPPATTLRMPLKPENLPRLLSETGAFASVKKLQPAPGVVAYDVIAPLWSDGAHKQRWIALPPDQAVQFAETGEWAFPAGAVFIKHFELGKRLETRLLVVDDTGNGYGVTYKWKPDASDAELLTDSQSEDVAVGRSRTQTWYYPSRADCLTCHTSAAKFVLGVKTRQLNGAHRYEETGVADNQLRTWNYLGMFEKPLEEARIPRLARLVNPQDEKATLEERARSYLDANCANCHRPGHVIRANFDARFDAPGLINAPTVSDSLNLADPRLIAPRDVARSMIHHRLTRSDHYRMPQLANNVRDQNAIALLEKWINELPPGDKPLPEDDKRSKWLKLIWSDERRVRVNSPDTATGPFKDRKEAAATGKLTITVADDLKHVAAAELYLELWGGHPGTANKSFTVNGNGPYPLPKVGVEEDNCCYHYPVIPLKVGDLVKGQNVLQFACEKGSSSWGHFIINHACLRLTLKDDHPELKKAGLDKLDAGLGFEWRQKEKMRLSLKIPKEQAQRIAGVEYEGLYSGYDENGDGRFLDWHGFTKTKSRQAILGAAQEPPYTVEWDLTMVPDQKGMKVRAWLRPKDAPDLAYVTAAAADLATPKERDAKVSLHLPKDLPRPFWSRAAKEKKCIIVLEQDPATITKAELHVTIWDGGRGKTEAPFTLNGHALEVAGAGKHDLLYRIVLVDPKILKKGANEIRVLSDTEHHGIEVLLPGPALMVRVAARR